MIILIVENIKDLQDFNKESTVKKMRLKINVKKTKDIKDIISFEIGNQ